MPGNVYKEGGMEKIIRKEVPLPGVEKKEGGITSNRRNFVKYGLAALGIIVSEEIAIGAIRNYLSEGGAEARNIAPYTGEVPSTFNPADYVDFLDDGSVSFAKLDASTEKLGWIVDYSIIPKSGKNDNIMDNGVFSPAQIYAGVISDGKESRVINYFNKKFLEQSGKKMVVMGANKERSIDFNNNAVFMRNLEDLEVDTDYGIQKDYRELGKTGFFYQIRELHESRTGLLFSSPDKSAVVMLARKVA